jgi:hypothetical protein
MELGLGRDGHGGFVRGNCDGTKGQAELYFDHLYADKKKSGKVVH